VFKVQCCSKAQGGSRFEVQGCSKVQRFYGLVFTKIGTIRYVSKEKAFPVFTGKAFFI
jgi:hypothetical protein